MAKLGVLVIDGTKYTLRLGETYLIGRKISDQAHDIEIDDTSVDVKHCILDFTDKRLRLFDIRSKCGTFVDGIRVTGCEVIPNAKSSTIQFGDVEATLQLVSEGDSGYLEGRLTPPAKNNSEIICNSPENVPSSGSRLRNTLKDTVTSTPNATTASTSSIHVATKSDVEFLIPTKLPRRSANINTSINSVDSFYIPETQYPTENKDQTNNSTNVSIDTNKSNDKSINIHNDDDDFFIPETQEIVGATGRLSNYPRVAFGHEDINETIGDTDKIPSSQFRICTQDFNGSDDELSNNSDDILANVPCSMVIPVIRHEPVQINDILNANEDEEETDKEMSALQWSKRTSDNADGSITPDNIPHTDSVVTPDIIQNIKDADPPPSNPATGTNPKETEVQVTSDNIEKNVSAHTDLTDHDLQPTQVFIKPAVLNKSDVKSSPLPCDKENIGPKDDDSLFLPATQVFILPSARPKPVSVLPPPPPPPPPPPSSSSVASANDDDDLPPTQVFQIPAPSSSKNNCFSSTLVESGLQLFENSFKTNCNKLLDSDDDEMDEIIAPELVRNMRKPLDKAVELTDTVSVETTTPVLQAEKLPKENISISTSKENPIVAPKEKKFATPSKVAKKSSRPQPAVSIDNFLFTPDFLGKEFSKDEKLQKLAEVNWKNLISEKQRKTLFGEEDSDGNPLSSETDDSQDSFNDLLPYKEKQGRTEKKSDQEEAPKSKSSKESIENTKKSEMVKKTETPKGGRQEKTKSESEKVKESKTSKDKQEKTKTKSSKKAESSKSSEELVVRRERNSLTSEVNFGSTERKSDQGDAPQSKSSKESMENTKKSEMVDETKTTQARQEQTKSESEKVKESKTSKDKQEKTKPKSSKKVESSNSSEEPVVRRITRRRKSVFPEESKEAKMPRRETSKESKDDSENNEKESKTATTKPELKAAKSVETKSLKLSKEKKKDSKQSANETSDSSMGRERVKLRRMSHKEMNHQHRDKKEEDKRSEERPEKSSKKTTEVKAKRITRQSSQELNVLSTNESIKSTHHNEDNDPSHNRSNSIRKKSSSDHRNVSKQKESETETDSAEKSVKKLLRSASESIKSSSLGKQKSDLNQECNHKSSTNSLNKLDKKELVKGRKEESKKKREYKKSKEKEDKPLPRSTRLRSAKDLVTATETTAGATGPDQEKEEKGARKDINERSKTEFTSPTDHLRYQSPSIRTIDLTDSDVEDRSTMATAKSGKRKNEGEGTRIKRLRSTTSTDSASADQINGSRISRSQTKTKIAMTMCDPRYQEILERHSGGLWLYTKDPKECDVLVVEKGNRTYKLMVAIARGAPIVKLDWLKEVLKKKSVDISFEHYIFEDPLFQERHQFHMKKSLNLAKTTSLFDGISFMMTPGIRPIPEEMRDIIICAGGTVLEHIPKQQAKQRIYLISQAKDNQYWHRFRRANSNIKIVTTEGVMSSVMQQCETPLIKSVIN